MLRGSHRGSNRTGDEVTRRKHNFEAKIIVKLNQVIRGTAQYFATPFFTARETFHNRSMDSACVCSP